MRIENIKFKNAKILMMNNDKMLIVLDNLAAALHLITNEATKGMIKKAVTGRLKVVENTLAELRSDMKPKEELPPQLNKHDVSRSAGCYLADKNNFFSDKSVDNFYCLTCKRNVEGLERFGERVEDCGEV